MIRLVHQGWARTTEVFYHDKLLTMVKKKKMKKEPCGIGVSQKGRNYRNYYKKKKSKQDEVKDIQK